MTRPVLAAWLLLCSTGAVSAQSGDTPPAPAQQDPQAAYQELARSHGKAVTEWREAAKQAIEAARAAGTEVPASVMRRPTKEFVDRALALASEFGGTDAAVPFLVFVVKNASDEHAAVQQALKALWADHSATAAIAPALDHVARAYFSGHDVQAQVDQLLDAVVEDNPDVDVKAQALIARGTLRLQLAANDEQRTSAVADIRKASATSRNPEVLKQAKDALFEIENLQVGCTAPDIVAKDTDGVDFRLADYRGKVVLLDFWGFW